MNLEEQSRNVALVDLLDRALEKGVAISGDLIISLADVDLLFVGLRLLVAPVDKCAELVGKSE